jgi:hypothetical protein
MQFDAIDGGERAANNSNYYLGLGVAGTLAGSFISISNAAISGKDAFSFGNNQNTPSCYWTPKVSFSSATFFHGVRILIQQYPFQIDFFNANRNAQFSVVVNVGGSISIVSNNVILATSPSGLILLNTAFYLEIYGVISASLGAVTIRLNGNPSPVMTPLVNVNTAADTSSLPITYFHYSCNASFTSFVRDMYVHDGTGASPFNTFLGNVGCEWLPVASLVSSAFTPVGGTNLSNAASTPPNPTVDYNESSTVGALDKFGITALPSDVASVIAVMPVDYSYKSDTGPRALQKTLYSGSSTVVGTENYLNESPTCNQDPWVTKDPATSANWTNTAVNAISISYEIAA